MKPNDELLVGKVWESGLSGKAHLNQKGDLRHARLWVRDEFKCVYCDEPLLGDFIRFFSSQLDHLLPQATYPHLKEIEENWVLACFPCNQLKRAFDPWKELKGPETRPELSELISKRGLLIEECRRYLQPRRKKWNDMHQRVIAVTNGG